VGKYSSLARTGGLGEYPFDGKEFCVLIDFKKDPAVKMNLLVKLTSVRDYDQSETVVADAKTSALVLKDKEDEIVEKSAFFGEANGEWSIIDVAFIAVIGVLLLCFCLGLYSCWSKKKKNKEQAEKDCAKLPPAKYNHRRQLAIE